MTMKLISRRALPGEKPVYDLLTLTSHTDYELPPESNVPRLE